MGKNQLLLLKKLIKEMAEKRDIHINLQMDQKELLVEVNLEAKSKLGTNEMQEL